MDVFQAVKMFPAFHRVGMLAGMNKRESAEKAAKAIYVLTGVDVLKTIEVWPDYLSIEQLAERVGIKEDHAVKLLVNCGLLEIDEHGKHVLTEDGKAATMDNLWHERIVGLLEKARDFFDELKPNE